MNTSELIRESIQTVGPGIALLFAACVFLCFIIFGEKADDPDAKDDGYAWGTLAVLLLVWAFWAFRGTHLRENTKGLFIADLATQHGLHLTMIGGIFITLISMGSVTKRVAGEFYSCMLFLLSGLIFVSAASDLTSLYLGLELVSIPTTLLLTMGRSDRKGREATLKYFALSAFSSAVLLMGASYLYGLSGSTSLQSIRESIAVTPSLMARIAMALVLIGLAFRVTAVPFHFYAPDVFSGTSLPMASLIAYLPKVAGFMGMVRLLGGASLTNAMTDSTFTTLIALAIVTMTLGNFLALVQDSWRRLLAYSSVAHSGYLLLGLAAILRQGGDSRPIFSYLAAYAVMTLGMFAALTAMAGDDKNEDMKLSELRGLFKRSPWLGAAATVCLLSLIGMPLTAGFWAKLQLFLAAVQGSHPWLRAGAIIMAINAAIGAIYYLNALVRIYGDPDKNAKAIAWSSPSWACVLCAAITILWFFVPAWM